MQKRIVSLINFEKVYTFIIIVNVCNYSSEIVEDPQKDEQEKCIQDCQLKCFLVILSFMCLYIVFLIVILIINWEEVF